MMLRYCVASPENKQSKLEQMKYYCVQLPILRTILSSQSRLKHCAAFAWTDKLYMGSELNFTLQQAAV